MKSVDVLLNAKLHEIDAATVIRRTDYESVHSRPTIYMLAGVGPWAEVET